MFSELYHRVAALIDGLCECQKEFLAIPKGKLREQGQEIIDRMRDLMNKLRNEPEEAHLVRAVPKFRETCGSVANIFNNIQASAFSDMLKCDCPTCQSAEAGLQSTIPIDRPSLPEPPLKIPGEALVAYLQQLTRWIREAYEDLSLGEELEELELPSVGGRYVVADVGQLVFVAERLKIAEDLRRNWEKLTREEGPRWDSVDVGLARIGVIMAAVQVLTSIVKPPEEHTCSIGKIIGQAIDENGLPPGPGGFLFGSFGPEGH